MGIRFYCPNGHKLHVKEFQAGHRGICPYCGASVDIPLTSTRSSSKGKNSTGHKQRSGTDSINLNAITPSNTPDEMVQTGFTATGQDKEIELSAPLNRPITVPDVPVEKPTQPANPFEEAPNAVWYVKPSAGGQYGPASADIMKSWLEEGRIANDSMVWREGWTDWKMASDVFEQLTPHRMDFHLDVTSSNKTTGNSKSTYPAQSQFVEPINPNTSQFNSTNSQKSRKNTKPQTAWHQDVKTIIIIAQSLIILGLIIGIILK